MKVAGWMAAKGFRLPQKTWDGVLLKMIKMDLSMTQMTEWMDTAPAADLTRSMIYVLCTAINTLHKPEVVPPLIEHYLKHASIRDKPQARQAFLGYVLEVFLDARPTLRALNEYLACIRSDQQVMPWGHCRSVVSFYLDPSHYGDDYSNGQVTESLLAILRECSTVLKWHSGSDLSTPERLGSEGIPDDERASMETVVQESLSMLEQYDREAYLYGVYGRLNNPEFLYEAAKIRSSRIATLMDYDLYHDGVIANTYRHADPKAGSLNAIEMAGWMASKGFLLPKKTWVSVLLKMIAMDLPMDQLKDFMDAQPSTHLTTAMIYVLSAAVDILNKPEVVLPLVHHYLDLSNAQTTTHDRQKLLTFVFHKFLASGPSLPLLHEYLSLMQKYRARISRETCEMFVAYYSDPSHHATGRSDTAIAADLADLMRDHPGFFVADSPPGAPRPPQQYHHKS